MLRLLVGTLVGGLVLFACGAFSRDALPGSLLSAFLATLLLLQLGPRSLVEKVLFLLTAALLTWSGRGLVRAGPFGPGPLAELSGLLLAWLLAGSALAWITRPRSE